MKTMQQMGSSGMLNPNAKLAKQAGAPASG